MTIALQPKIMLLIVFSNGVWFELFCNSALSFYIKLSLTESCLKNNELECVKHTCEYLLNNDYRVEIMLEQTVYTRS